MQLSVVARACFAAAAVSFAISVAGAQCAAGSSASNTQALVELYTSQGCPRCAEAGRRLSELAVQPNVVAVSVPVDEPGSGRELALRRRRLTNLQRLALVSSPLMLVQGFEFRDWATPALDEALARTAAQPPRASLRLEILSVAQGEMRVRARAATPFGRPQDLRLYLAAYDREPHNPELRIRQWTGPLPLRGPATQEQVLAGPAGPSGKHAGVVGFLQDRRNSEVLQALMLPACP